jgi:hypothetical protein
MAALHICDGLVQHENPELLKNLVSNKFEKKFIKPQIAQININYPIDFTDKKWLEIAQKSSDSIFNTYNN